MPTPLYNTDVQKIVDRTPKTALLDTDVFVVADEDGTLAPITKPNAKATLGIDDAEDRLDTLEGADTVDGSVLKDIKDNAENATYDNTDSGLTANTLKTAIDEVDGRLDTAEDDISDLQTAENAIKGTGWTDENLVDHEIRIQKLEFIPAVTSWADVQKIVREGRASAYFPVGTQFEAMWNGVSIIWDVIGINHDIPTNTAYTRSLTLQANKILRTGRISAPEAMYNAVTELPAGTYIFTTNGLQYTFTSTQAVPAGGVIYIKTRSEYVPLTLTIYAADRKTVIEDDIAVTATTGTDTITPINDHVRMRYGNNNYEISALRQWLNSEEDTFTWVKRGLYDMPSTYETAGFLKLLDAELLAVIGHTDKQVAKATYDGGEQSLLSDKVFLLSRKEIFGDDEGTVTGESQYAFWAGKTNADRIKTYLSGSVGNWWLRSPYVSSTYDTLYVKLSGDLSSNVAHSSYGLAPACVII